MKDIVLIAIIDKDRKYGRTLNTNDHEFDLYIRGITNNGIIAISDTLLACMTNKSNPFPARPTYIVSEYGNVAENMASNVTVVKNLHELFEETLYITRTLYIFLDQAMQEKIYEEFEDHISTIYVGTLNTQFEDKKLGTFPETLSARWQRLPEHKREWRGKRDPGFTIEKYTPHLVFTSTKKSLH